MTPDTQHLVLTIVCSGLQLVLGLAVGYWIKARRTAKTFSEAHVRQLMDQVQSLVMDVSGNVGNHSSRIVAINQSLTLPSDRRPQEVFLEAVTQVVSANKLLQDQLASAEQQLQDQARQLDHKSAEARIDFLTKLGNRRAFDDELQRRIAELGRTQTIFSLLVIDIDHFKQFNDRFGHETGDQVLIQVAQTLVRTMRTMDLAARYGGEEFCVVLPATDLDRAKVAAERARQAVAACQFRLEALDCPITVSIGVAQASNDDTRASLFERADAAMYAAKAGGRNRCYFHDGADSHQVAPPIDRKPALSAAKNSINDRKQVPMPADVNQADKSSTVDLLSALPNRHQFFEALRQWIADYRGTHDDLSLVLFYVDDLKRVNAGQGRPIIDAELQQVGRLLCDLVADRGTVFCFGFERFSIMLPHLNARAAVEVDRLVRRSLSQAFGSSLVIHSGIAERTYDDDIVALVTRVENSLETSINAGRNGVHVCIDTETSTIISRQQPSF